MTAVANTVFTAAQFNTHVRDNLNETAPAKVTAAGQIVVSNGVNSIVARTPTNARVDTSQTTTSGAYGDLATVGPAVTVTTGTSAIVFIQCQLDNNTLNANSSASYAVSGATTVAAGDGTRISREGCAATTPHRYGMASVVALTAGSNTFTMKYRCQAATTGTFSQREIIVIPL
jgi:hypothetical protein